MSLQFLVMEVMVIGATTMVILMLMVIMLAIIRILKLKSTMIPIGNCQNNNDETA